MQSNLPKSESNARKSGLFLKNSYFYRGVASLSPDYFALVMATGIVSIALFLFGYVLLAQILFYLNITAYLVLCLLYGIQINFFWKRFRSHFFNLEKNMSFLTFVAANCIVGSQFITLFKNHNFAILFLCLGVISWIFLIYALFAIHVEKRYKTSLKAISGTWLLIVVATQAISILSVQLEAFLPISQHTVLFFSLLMFLIGCLFYIVLITLIIYRLLFFEVRAQKFGTPYWISMGADAISVLAGTTLISIAGEWTVLNELLPFIKGFTLLFWAIGTWWIPLMVLLGIWRHIIKRVPVKYSSPYWGMVFPLGMYTVCTLKLAQVFNLPSIMSIPSAFMVIALFVWVIVFAAMIYAIIQRFQNKKVKGMFDV